MRCSSTLFLWTISVLITAGKDPLCGKELQAAYIELDTALAEISALKLEIVQLREELDVCARGQQWSLTQQVPERRGQGTEDPVQVDALPWTLLQGEGYCYIDTMGCFESRLAREIALNIQVDLDMCSTWTAERCVVEISPDWEGSLGVVASYHRDYAPDVLEVNEKTYTFGTEEELALTGVHGMVAFGKFSWRPVYTGVLCSGIKICPMDFPSLPGPWLDDPWTCTVHGDSCIVPFEVNGVAWSTCTQQFSDLLDADDNGSLHNGHPRCQSATGYSLCGPCRCVEGEEQTYNSSSVYPHTETVPLITCAPCAAGRFKSFGSTLDGCDVCPPGTSSPLGATACTNCLPGMFNDHEILECASCQLGFFGDEVGLTMCQMCASGTYTDAEQQTVCASCLPGMFKGYEMLECASCHAGFFGSGSGLTVCQECATDSYASTERQTACDICFEGTVLVAQDEECQPCPPGTFRNVSMTSCSPCDAGSYQHQSGQAQCQHCAAVLNPGGPNPHLWTTMVRIQNVKWQETDGSHNVRDCGCAAGAWVDALGQCQACGEGITCKGMGEVEVLPGFFAGADSAGFVWRCHGADWARCPGGRPGTCARQRLNTSIACEECEPYTRMTNDGPCKACSGPDVGLLIGAIIGAVAVIWCVYCVIARDNQAKKRESFVFVSTVCSQFVTLFQMLGVLQSLSVAWPEPFATVVELGSLMNFRLEVLSVGCVLSAPPLHRYTANAFTFVVLTLLVVACHSVHVMVFHFAQFKRAHFRQFMPALFGAVGTVFMAVYISVCAASVQPLQCDVHPNGSSTMRAYRQVTCWDGGDHQYMMMTGALASLVPLAFLSLSAWVTVNLPKRLHKGDTVFLNTFGFLLFRFRPGAHSYVLVLLLRNLGLAVVPVMTDPALELFASAAVVMACVLVCVSMSPWAVRQASHLDVVMHTGLLFILLFAALQTHRVDEVVIGNLLLFVFSAVMCAFLGASAWSLHLCAHRLKKPFQFFLCHHKVGGGAFCRLLKMRLLSCGQVARGVFLDSDNLQDLSLLFGIVAEKTETLVVLCTREILRRPWCVGEMTTARLHGIDTILVIFPDFEHPSHSFIADYAGVEGVLSLAPYGISLEMAQQTLWWLGTRPWIVLPRSVNSEGFESVVQKIVGRRKGRRETAPTRYMVSVIDSHESEHSEETEETMVRRWRSGQTFTHWVSEPNGWSTPDTNDIVSIVDHTNQESVCTALVVQELLKAHFPLTGPGHVLGPDENLPRSATLLLVMSSNGCFQRPRFVRQLLQAENLGIGAVPIIVDDSFQFPSDAFFQEIRALSDHILSGTERNADELITLIKTLFEEIGIHVRPQDAQGVLEVRAATIAHRFSAPRRTLSSRRAPSRCEASTNVFDLEVIDEEAQVGRVQL